MAAAKKSNDISLVRELADILNETDLNEIEMKKGDLKIRVSKGGGQIVQTMAAAPMAAPAPAAKTFNPITAPKSGKVEAVYIEDAQPVEFGEALFVIV